MSFVSVIIPCYNEQTTIQWLLDAIFHQSYPLEQMEVIIADGLSTDGTRHEVDEFQKNHPDLQIKLVDNHQRIIPAALNTALEAAQGEFIIRLDAHSIPAPDYIQRCVDGLKSGLGDNVGGIWEIKPGNNSWIAKSIAAAAAHPLGVGDARYRTHNSNNSNNESGGEVDTVPFGAFHRDIFDKLGGFDENLLSNEDYEFNARLRKIGGRVWLDPKIRSTYFSRSTLGALSRQYWRYGYWKWHMIRHYPSTLKIRQALPPLFSISLILLLFLSFWSIFFQFLLTVEVVAYFLIIFVGVLPASIQRKDPLLCIGIPLAIATMHLSWGTGLIWSMITTFITGLRK